MTEESCAALRCAEPRRAAPIWKVKSHISNRLCATLWWSVNSYWDSSGSEWVGKTTGTHWGEGNIHEWRLGFNAPNLLGQPVRQDRFVWTTCSSSVWSVWSVWLLFIPHRKAFRRYSEITACPKEINLGRWNLFEPAMPSLLLTAALSCWSIESILWFPLFTPLNVKPKLEVTELWELVTIPSWVCPRPGVAVDIIGVAAEFSKDCWETCTACKAAFCCWN